MADGNDTIFRHLYNAVIWSVAGIRKAWENELAFKLQAIVIIIMLPVGIWLGRTAVEKALLIGSCALILIVELLNSAVEAVVDRIGSGRHELSGRAKDMGSAASFFSMITAAVVWALIAYERFYG